MGDKDATAKTDEHAKPEAKGQKPSNGWGPIFSRAIGELFSGSWLQNLIVGLALLLIGPLIGATLMNSRKATVIGFGIGVTLLIWIGVIILARQINNTKPTPLAPFTISPETINLFAHKGHKAMQEIFIHNQTQVAYYDVWAKVVVNSPSIKARNIEIHRPDASPINLLDKDPTEALDNLLVVTIPDPDTNFFFFSVGRLAPNGTKRYVFSYQNNGELSESENHQVALTVDRFTTNPAPSGSYPVRESSDKEPQGRPNLILKYIKLIKNPEGRPAANVALTNDGAEAFQFSCVSAIFGATSSEAEKFRPSVDIPTQPMDLGAGHWVDQTLAMKPVDEAWKQKFAKGDIKLYVWGEAKYQDKTGKWFHYDFCQILNPKTELWESCSFHNRSY